MVSGRRDQSGRTIGTQCGHRLCIDRAGHRQSARLLEASGGGIAQVTEMAVDHAGRKAGAIEKHLRLEHGVPFHSFAQRRQCDLGRVCGGDRQGLAALCGRHWLSLRYGRRGLLLACGRSGRRRWRGRQGWSWHPCLGNQQTANGQRKRKYIRHRRTLHKPLNDSLGRNA